MKRTLVKVVTVILGITVCIGMQTNIANASPSGNNPVVAPINSEPYGKSYGEWAVEWWKWRLATPSSINPGYTTNPCDGGQQGKVWFLGSDITLDYTKVPTSPTDYYCTVPAGKALFIPMVNNGYFAFPTDPADERTLAFVRSVSVCKGPVKLSASIDKVPVKDPTRYYERSPFFEVQLPTDNILQLPPILLSPSADSGYYLFIDDLEPGEHHITLSSDWYNCGAHQYITPEIHFRSNYTIMVEPH